MKQARMIVMTDGSSRGNPGPGAIGWLIWCGDATRPTVKGNDLLGDYVTCNMAEWEAALRGIEECIKLGASSVHLILDSQLVQRQMTGAYTVQPGHPLVLLHERFLKLEEGLEQFTATWVPRQIVHLADLEAAQANNSRPRDNSDDLLLRQRG